jgi:hypothetical protein
MFQYCWTVALHSGHCPVIVPLLVFGALHAVLTIKGYAFRG